MPSRHETRHEHRYIQGKARIRIILAALLALAVDPNDPEALCSAARRKSYSGEDHEGAFALVKRATELCPNSASAWSHRGSTCVYIARSAEAVSSYERAIRLSPMDLMLYATLTGLSVALIQLERYEEALDAA